jgi:hypothetical protein
MTKAILAVGAGRREATLAAFWLLAQSLSAAGIPLTDIHIRDPFVLPVQQATNYYHDLLPGMGPGPRWLHETPPAL